MCSKFMNVYMLYFVLFSNKRFPHILTPVIYYAFLILNRIKVIKIMWSSQMAHAKNIGEPFMAHAKKLYNIPCIWLYFCWDTWCCSSSYTRNIMLCVYKNCATV